MRDVSKRALHLAEEARAATSQAAMNLASGSDRVFEYGASLPLTVGPLGSAAAAAQQGNRFVIDANATGDLTIANGVREGEEIEISVQFDTGTQTVTVYDSTGGAGHDIASMVTGAAAGDNAYMKLVWTGTAWHVSALGIGTTIGTVG